MNVQQLGEARFPSPLCGFVSDQVRIPAQIEYRDGESLDPSALWFEKAGPREKLFFNPAETSAGIVTCGGLCPGLNDVVRSVVLELRHNYGVKHIHGFRYGYKGLDPDADPGPIELTSEVVGNIHREGGTILGTSRGPVDVARAVDNLIARRINILFTLGGDGTQRGANAFYQEARRRNHPLAVVGIPKTIDNDVPFVARSFGYLTSVEEAQKVLNCAHTEATSAENGIALVRLMGRHAGYIAAGAALASQDVNFVLVPEVPLVLDGERGFLAALESRMRRRGHALVVVAEGAGQDLLAADASDRDASGNVKLRDIGPFLRQRIEEHFKARQFPITMRYFDPSYSIRSAPADAEDSILADLFARNAVHAAMAGKTGLVIGFMHDVFVHAPIETVVSLKKQLQPGDQLWQAVLACTGQPATFG